MRLTKLLIMPSSFGIVHRPPSCFISAILLHSITDFASWQIGDERENPQQGRLSFTITFDEISILIG